MDITFVINNKPETVEFNVDKKTGAVFKSYRPRTVKFELDTLKVRHLCSIPTLSPLIIMHGCYLHSAFLTMLSKTTSCC